MNFQHYKQNTHLLQIQFPAFVWVAGLLLTNGQLVLQCLADPQALKTPICSLTLASTIASMFLLCLLTASKTVFRETSSAGPWLSSIVENNYFFITENTTIRAGPIVLNDTSHSTAHEAGKRSASMGR
jgi:hypothetical protein